MGEVVRKVVIAHETCAVNVSNQSGQVKHDKVEEKNICIIWVLIAYVNNVFSKWFCKPIHQIKILPVLYKIIYWSYIKWKVKMQGKYLFHWTSTSRYGVDSDKSQKFQFYLELNHFVPMWLAKHRENTRAWL